MKKKRKKKSACDCAIIEKLIFSLSEKRIVKKKKIYFWNEIKSHTKKK